MTGLELLAVWLFGIFCGSVTISSVVKAIATAGEAPAESSTAPKRATREDVR